MCIEIEGKKGKRWISRGATRLVRDWHLSGTSWLFLHTSSRYKWEYPGFPASAQWVWSPAVYPLLWCSSSHSKLRHTVDAHLDSRLAAPFFSIQMYLVLQKYSCLQARVCRLVFSSSICHVRVELHLPYTCHVDQRNRRFRHARRCREASR